MLGLGLLGSSATAALPVVMSSRCARRYARLDCSHCRDLCPVGAIDLGRGPVVRDSACAGCGICAAVCPTGAVTQPETLWQQLERALRGPGVYLSCALGPRRYPGPAMPCLGALDVPLLLAACGRLGSVRLRVSGCASCMLGSSLPRLRDVVAEVNACASALAPGYQVSLDVTGDEPPPAPATYSRRQLFAALKGQPPDEKLEREDVSHEAVHRSEVGAPQLPRRREELLAYAVTLLLESRGPEVEPIALPVRQPIAGERTCSYCGICVRACPTHALEIQRPGNAVVLSLGVARCLGCTLCLEVCPEGALSARASTTAQDMATAAVYWLHHQRLSPCPQCGRTGEGMRAGQLCQDCARERDVLDFFSGPRPL